jgi:hypothetical protein
MNFDYDDLPAFGDRYLQYFNTNTEAIEIRSRSIAAGNLNVSQALELIDLFLKKHQMTYIPHMEDNNLFMFPFMFIEPSPGDKIRNRKTGEMYTIDQVIKNPKTKKWHGLLRLDLTNAPSITNNEELEFEKFDNYLEFNYIYPESISNSLSTNREERLREVPSNFRPTITWNLIRREPGSMGRKIFDTRKELKPRLREMVKDPLVPGHTVEIFGQVFDNLVQFDCWSGDYKTSEILVGWFEQFLSLYTKYVRQYGVSQLIFWQRTDDNIETSWRQTFNVRGTQFYLRTEDLYAEYSRDLLRLNINVDQEITENRIFRERRYIADQLVTGELTYDEYRALFTRSGEHLFINMNIDE